MKGLGGKGRLALLYALSLFVRGVHLGFLRTKALPLIDAPNLDESFYSDWADSILATGILGSGAFDGMPLLPYGLAMVRGVFGSGSLAVSMVQLLLFSATPVFVFLLAQGLFPSARSTAWLAGIFASFASPLVAYGFVLVPASLAGLLSTASLWLLIRGGEEEITRWRWRLIGAGALFGLCVLARAQMLAFLPAAAVVLFLRERGAIFMRSKGAIFFALGCALPVFPVALRNLVVTGDVTLVASNGGVNFYIGNGRTANGIWAAPEGMRRTRVEMITDAKDIAEADRGRSLAPGEVSSFWYGKAWREMADDPARSVRLMVRKTRLAIAAFEIPNVVDLQVLREFSVVLRIFPRAFAVLLPLALIAAFSAGRPRNELWMPVLYVGTGTGLMVLFFVNERFRVPLLPVLCCLGAGGVSEFLRSAQKKQWWRVGRFAFFVVVGWGISFPHPFEPRDASKLRASSYVLAASSFQAQKEWAQAEVLYDRAIEWEPDSVDARFRAAHCLASSIDDAPSAAESERRIDAALSAYRELLRRHPDHPEGNRNASVLLIQRRMGPNANDGGRAAATEAVGYLSRVISVQPDDANLRISYGIVLLTLGDRVGAIEQYSEAVKLDPTLSRVRERLEVLRLE